jgi:hypothetical protein
MNHPSNVTMIEDLPELEQLDGIGEPRPPQYNRNIMEQQGLSDEKLQKYIRNPHRIDPSAGMTQNPNYPQNRPNQDQPEIDPEQPRMVYKTREMPVQYPNDPLSYNCLDIARHIQDCPLCSKYYNNDKTAYVIAIIVLSIICLLLLKKVLDV